MLKRPLSTTDLTPAEEPAGPSGIEDVLSGLPGALKRNLVLLGLTVVVLVAALAAVLAWRQYDAGRRSAVREVEARVALAATVFDTYFTGQISTLQGMAQAPAVLALDLVAMRQYFDRMQKANPRTFSGGIAWIDSHGILRVSGMHPESVGLRVADRSYFQNVVKTGKPFVSEGLVSRADGRVGIGIAVPTRDRHGRITGVLTGSLKLQPRKRAAPSKSAVDLGYAGLAVLDRLGQNLMYQDLRRPSNGALAKRIESAGASAGVLTNTRGLEGTRGHVVGYAPSRVPGWTVAIDRPRSAVFAAARRGLAINLSLDAMAALIILGLLFWALQQARRSARRTRADVRIWKQLTEELAAATTSADVANALVTALSSGFGDVDVVVALDVPGTRRLAMWTGGGVSSLHDFDELGDALSAALERAYESGSCALVREPPTRRPNGKHVTWLYTAPLSTAKRQAVGAVALLFSRGRSIVDGEEAIVVWQADQAAQALARTRSHETEHDIAMTLQRSLLPEGLPATDGVDIAGRYRAGGPGLEVGGDWYDVILRPDGILHVTVGDVAGHGIEAAARMGNLRSAFRAYAYESLSPAEILSRLGRHTTGDDALATAICLTLDPFAGELTYASAGHPPIVLYDAEHGVRQLSATAPPLGYSGGITGRDTTLAIGTGAILVAYTDGLVERRRMDITVGISRVGDVIERCTGMGADAIADAVLAELATPSQHADDVALLVLKVLEVPESMAVPAPADPALITALTRRVQRWATLAGLGRDERDAACAAIREALERISAAGGGGPGTAARITVLADGTVEVDAGEPGVDLLPR